MNDNIETRAAYLEKAVARRRNLLNETWQSIRNLVGDETLYQCKCGSVKGAFNFGVFCQSCCSSCNDIRHEHHSLLFNKTFPTNPNFIFGKHSTGEALTEVRTIKTRKPVSNDFDNLSVFSLLGTNNLKVVFDTEYSGSFDTSAYSEKQTKPEKYVYRRDRINAKPETVHVVDKNTASALSGFGLVDVPQAFGQRHV
jgi:hypothetical protein